MSEQPSEEFDVYAFDPRKGEIVSGPSRGDERDVLQLNRSEAGAAEPVLSGSVRDTAWRYVRHHFRPDAESHLLDIALRAEEIFGECPPDRRTPQDFTDCCEAAIAEYMHGGDEEDDDGGPVVSSSKDESEPSRAASDKIEF